MNSDTSYATRGAGNVGVKLVNTLTRWMAPMIALLLAGCATPTAQTGERPEPPASPPVVRGCEVGQQLPIGASCEWNIPDADGVISAESRDGRHLSLMLNVPGPCAFQREVRNPDDIVEGTMVGGGCINIFDLKDRRVDFGDGRGSGLMVELTFGEHGWTVVQAPPMTP